MNNTDRYDAELIAADELLREEADELMKSSGLRELLSSYGSFNLVGSYHLHLMTWRDLDITIEIDMHSADKLLELSGRLISLLQPAELFHINNIHHTPSLIPGEGMYWGMVLGPDDGKWKLDIWARSTHMRNATEARGRAIAAMLTRETRISILKIKKIACLSPDYRNCIWKNWDKTRTFNSVDIYSAVLDHGVKDIADFRAYLTTQGKAL